MAVVQLTDRFVINMLDGERRFHSSTGSIERLNVEMPSLEPSTDSTNESLENSLKMALVGSRTAKAENEKLYRFCHGKRGEYNRITNFFDQRSSWTPSELCSHTVWRYTVDNTVYSEASLFFLLCSEGKTYYVRQLLDGQPDLNETPIVIGTGTQGQTPLIVASKRGYYGICNLLLDAGAQAKICDSDGKSAVDYIKPKGWQKFSPETEKLISKLNQAKL
ncbi:MAG: ankyrin repeat domain-containing protein [Parashewanella sp.]